MFNKLKIKKTVKVVLFAGLIFLAIGFVGRKQHEKLIKNIVIRIDNPYDSYFIDQNDLMNLITENGTQNIRGAGFTELPLKEIEKRVKQHRFVQRAEVYKDLQGNLVVNAYQTVAIARVVQTDGPDAYISNVGKILPVSDKFTARVMVIGGEYTKKLVRNDLTNDSTSNEIFNLLKFILADDFWSIQVAQLDIDRNGEITFYPQVGKQLIEFGKAEDIETKFRKLDIFYKEILPEKGWNAYSRVNLKFNNQIICE